MFDRAPASDDVVVASRTIKRTSRLRRIRHGAAGVVICVLAKMLILLPRRAVLAAGRGAGSAAYWILRRERRIAHANLDIVFGDSMTRREKRRIVRDAFRQFGATVFGLFWAPRLSARNINRWGYIAPESEAQFRRARESGRGFVLTVPHYGDWELLSLAMGFWGYPYMAVGADGGNQAVASFLQRIRTVSGHVLIPPQYAMLKLFRHLKRGGSIAMMVDANVRLGRGGVWVDFFGLPVFNSHAAVELALRADAAILFGYVKRAPDGRWELVIEQEVEPARSGDRDADVRATTQRLADRCAELIRAHPEPWLWTYKRWKRRPAPERGRFPFYSSYMGDIPPLVRQRACRSRDAVASVPAPVFKGSSPGAAD